MSSYFVVAANNATLLSFKTREELVRALIALRKEERNLPTDKQVLLFYGDAVKLTKGEFKYVVFPDGSKTPLFLDLLEPEIDESGYLIDPELVRTAPEDEAEPVYTEEAEEDDS